MARDRTPASVRRHASREMHTRQLERSAVDNERLAMLLAIDRRTSPSAAQLEVRDTRTGSNSDRVVDGEGSAGWQHERDIARKRRE